MAEWTTCYDWLKWSLLVCGEVGYELSPAQGWGVGKALIGEEEAIEWMRRLGKNTGAQCFEAVGVSVDDFRGIEWLNKIGRSARDGCMVPAMQKEDDVKTVRSLIDDPQCMWL